MQSPTSVNSQLAASPAVNVRAQLLQQAAVSLEAVLYIIVAAIAWTQLASVKSAVLGARTFVSTWTLDLASLLAYP